MDNGGAMQPSTSREFLLRRLRKLAAMPQRHHHDLYICPAIYVRRVCPQQARGFDSATNKSGAHRALAMALGCLRKFRGVITRGRSNEKRATAAYKDPFLPRRHQLRLLENFPGPAPGTATAPDSPGLSVWSRDHVALPDKFSESPPSRSSTKALPKHRLAQSGRHRHG